VGFDVDPRDGLDAESRETLQILGAKVDGRVVRVTLSIWTAPIRPVGDRGARTPLQAAKASAPWIPCTHAIEEYLRIFAAQSGGTKTQAG
jgi:hypothetical protein